MARDVIIATFENRNQAYEAAKDIDKLDDSVIGVKSGAIVEKDLLGNVTWLDSKDHTGPWGTIAGATGGALLGALVGTLAGPAGTMTGAQVGAAAAATGSLLGGTVGATVDIASTGLKEDTSPRSPACCCRAMPPSWRRSRSSRPSPSTRRSGGTAA